MKCKVLVSSIILLYMAGFATAATLNVPSGSYPTIQSAIDAAVDGVDEVVVADGTHSGVGNIDLNFWGKAITVKSANGPANCTIDCQGLGRAFNFGNLEDDNSVVEGFTIKNGSATYGGGIECFSASPKISNCIIIDNSASIYGGGVDLYMSSAVITNCIINNNSSGSDGGGVNCDTDTGLPPTISFCEIIGNTTGSAGTGGGINFYKSFAVVKNCLLKDNAAGDVGGAVYLWDSGPEISNCTIVDNMGSDNFGGIYRETNTGLPTIKNSILWNNGDDLYNCLGLVSYSCVQDDDPGFGNISSDPMFRTGPLGDYYLSQIAAGQLADSNCVNRGEGSAAAGYTTATNNTPDADPVDIGYHYPDSGPVVNYLLTTSVVGANGSIAPDHPSPGSPYVQYAEVALTAAPYEGYEVHEWTGADNIPAAGEVNNVVTMDADRTVEVEFQALPMYTLTFTAGANGEIIEPRRPGTYYEGTVVDLIVEPAPGYRVKQWTGANDWPGWNMNTNTVTMTSNKTVTVTFELDYSNVIHVPGDYSEIQLAIDAASNGDTIVIADGTYPGIEFEINKNITITGQTPEDPNLVVIENVEAQWRASFTLTGAGGSGVCTISGLTLVNGSKGCPDAPDGQDPNNDGWDALCAVVEAGHVRIEGNHIVSNCIIRGHELYGGHAGNGADGSTGETYEIEDPNDPNETITVPDVGARFAGNGGDGGGAVGAGIYIHSGSPLIINTIIEDCTVIAGHGGNGGVGSDEEVDDANFPGAPGGDGGIPGRVAGGGVYCAPGTWPRFENCIIRNNTAVGSYGGDGGDAGETFPDGQYIDHKGGFGGLFVLDPNQPEPWTHSAFGAGVYVGGGADFNNCRFLNNKTYGAHSGVGGWWSISSQEEPRRNNYIPGFGAGVYCRNSTNTTFTDCIFQGNENVYGGYPGPHLPPDPNAYTINGPTGFGAAISIGETVGGTAHSELIDCSFAGNNSYFGGAFYGVNSELRFEDCAFIGNLGVVGGAVAVIGDSIAEISGSIFQNNVANYTPGPNQPSLVGGTGGGLYCMETELLASNCVITGNVAYSSGGGVYLGGDLESGNPALNNCLITDNTSGETGGGVACGWFVSPIISNCTIADNATLFDPSYGGGLFCTMNSLPIVIDSIIWGNDSIGGGQIAVTNGDLGFPLPSGLDITYSDIGLSIYVEEGSTIDGFDPAIDPINPWEPDTNNIAEDPYFIVGYYLSQFAAGQTEQSNCVDGGHASASGLGLDEYTTRVDEEFDQNIVDMGYHYPYIGLPPYEPPQPQTLLVAVGGGEGFYNNITDALHDAEDGDTVVVHPGTYYGGYLGQAVIVNKSVTVRSLDPDNPAVVAATIIDGYRQSQFNEGYNNLGVTFSYDTSDPYDVVDAVLDGFTIQNCGGYFGTGLDGTRTSPVHPDGWDGGNGGGAAIRIFSGNNNVSVTVKNCIIKNNIVIGGNGGIGVGADADQNAGRGGWGGYARGGAIYVSPGAKAEFVNCQVIDNLAQGGNGGNGGEDSDPGGMENYGGNWSRAEAFNIDPFSLSVTYVQGDLWEVWEADRPPDLIGLSPFPWNYIGDGRWYSGYGGGAFCGAGSEVSFTDCTIRGNRTYGGITGQGGFNTMGRPIEPLIPYVLPSFGGGVYCAAGSKITFTGCTLTDNIASDANDPNTADNHHIDPYLGHGGGVCAEDTATLEFTDCIFSENEASVGGGLHFGNANPLIIDSAFNANSAYQGGGVFGQHGLVTIIGSKITNNEAVIDEIIEPNDPNVTVLCSGGGLHLWIMDADIIDCEISANQASVSGGGVYFGGDINASGENASSFINCLLTNNTAGRDGGGISNSLSSQMLIANCTIAINNVSGIDFPTNYGGGLYCFDESNTDIIDSILWGNISEFGSQIAIEEGPAGSAVVNIDSSDVQGAQSNAYVGNGCTLNWDPNNLYTDPLFEVGPLGNYYLSQIIAGQSVDSPCVDVGSDLASRVGMSTYTTRTDHIFDRAVVDMGYHYSVPSLAAPCRICDFLYDYIIDFRDFSVFSMLWLAEGCSEGNGWCDGTDLSFDTYVDYDDLFILAECWLVEDDLPPEPNPSQWKIGPYSTTASPTQISMTAEPAVDNWNGDVEYYFECTYGACNDSDWQSDANYTDTGLATSVEYGYRVKAHDEAGNETLWSPIRYAITGEGDEPDPTDETPPNPNPMTWATAPYAISANAIQMLATTATDDDSGGVQYFFDERSGNPGGTDSGWVSDPNYIDTGLVTGLTYTYRVKARDVSINRNETGWSSEASATPEEDIEPPPTLIAPYIVSATQFDGGFDWYNVIVADTIGEAALYYRFVSLDNAALNSGWVPSTGTGTVPSGLGVISYEGTGVTYTVPVGPSHMTWEWQVCGSNPPPGDVIECSDVVMILP